LKKIPKKNWGDFCSGVGAASPYSALQAVVGADRRGWGLGLTAGVGERLSLIHFPAAAPGDSQLGLPLHLPTGIQSLFNVNKTPHKTTLAPPCPAPAPAIGAADDYETC